MPRLLLVRHAATVGANGRYWGRTDHPLSQAGLAQARRIAGRLATEPAVAVHSSDRLRARATAACLAPGLPAIVHPDLRELDFGYLEGLTWQEAARLYPQSEEFWSCRRLDVSLPGGESIADLFARVGRFLAEVREGPEDQALLVVAHGGSLRALICLCLGLPPASLWKLKLDHASLTVLDLGHEGPILRLLNDTCHLQP
ncbi:MAG: histidine phosphatase family protein [Chloroflexi bacterium]|nr:histidine phosphatase family protein [Chloroflexota bacterium]MCL5109107.1 histidine phosphatase family protein [Chloroflexota bacterium]